MNTKYWDKAALYNFTDRLRTFIKLEHNNYPLSAVDIAYAHCKNLALECRNFNTTDICGILYKGEKTTSICLNNKRSKAMRNFDCAHELIHYFFHDIEFCQCICSAQDSTRKAIMQDPFLEWQANEGAAELLVPYKNFIPLYVETARKNAGFFERTDCSGILSKKYGVTASVINNRIDSLTCEIYQYLSGVNIESIKLFSKNQLRKIDWKKTPEKTYCMKCYAVLDTIYTHCPICGSLTASEEWGVISFAEGVGYMIYDDGIELNKNGKALRCPVCDNENVTEDGDYCHICGTCIVNRCTNGGTGYDSCGAIAESNGRYCVYCGAPTTFYSNGFLVAYKDYGVKESCNLPALAKEKTYIAANQTVAPEDSTQFWDDDVLF